VIVMSGAMAASLALPASATAPSATRTTTVALGVAVKAPSAAQAPLVPQEFGNISFRGADTTRPVPARTTAARTTADRATADRATADRASRSATRVVLPHLAPAAAPRSAGVLGIAASLAGIYYIYGGTTTAGFDCSGYTQYVFAQVGISLPRTAEEQRQATTPVTNPQPGDLVFFGAPAHHVGIYAGNGMMWDSEQTGVPVMLHTDRSERNGGATYGRV
jgi:peptidoglycan DL-endopeptidase CwlO